MNITEALMQPWTRIYVRVLAAVVAYGGLVHIGNMLGFNGLPWTESQLHFRIMDVVLLAFNVVVGLGLWLRQSWAVVAFSVWMVLFQIIPYTLFRQYFIQRPEDASTLAGLVGTVALLLGVLIVLIVAKK